MGFLGQNGKLLNSCDPARPVDTNAALKVCLCAYLFVADFVSVFKILPDYSPFNYGTYHPLTDGQSERTIQILEYMLRACAIDFVGSWDKYLPLVEFSSSYSYHFSIKMPPYEMLYGRKSQTPIYIMVDEYLGYVEEPVEILDTMVKKLKRKEFLLFKVRWKHKKGLDYTWEPEEELIKYYPASHQEWFVRTQTGMRESCEASGVALKGKKACSSMLCDLDFEPLTLSLTSMPSCDLKSLTNILILCLILKASNQSLRKSLSLNLELS
ncbi:putative reverse transcriptase domain-containing protein [Tanacetum coccineum]